MNTRPVRILLLIQNIAREHLSYQPLQLPCPVEDVVIVYIQVPHLLSTTIRQNTCFALSLCLYNFFGCTTAENRDAEQQHSDSAAIFN